MYQITTFDSAVLTCEALRYFAETGRWTETIPGPFTSRPRRPSCKDRFFISFQMGPIAHWARLFTISSLLKRIAERFIATCRWCVIHISLCAHLYEAKTIDNACPASGSSHVHLDSSSKVAIREAASRTSDNGHEHFGWGSPPTAGRRLLENV